MLTDSPDLLYDQMAGHIAHLIDRGTLRAGERIPSVRSFSQQQGVSVSTVLQAYRTLAPFQLVRDSGKARRQPE